MISTRQLKEWGYDVPAAGGRVAQKTKATDAAVRSCRVCGCTDLDCSECVAATGKSCHWVEPDLCSRCISSVRRPAIRLPRLRKANGTELKFEAYAQECWKPWWIQYEPLTLRLPSGTRYTPDYCACIGTEFYCFEVKGAHIHNAASLRAFKEARAAFPHWRFVFAQWKGGEWLLAGTAEKS